MTFKTMSSHIKGLLPMASHQQIRDLTFKRMKAAAAAFALAFEEANKYEQQAMESVVHDWMKEVSKCADDPSYAPTTDARTMTAYEASYFSSLGHGIFWSYLCRKKACQFFGPNDAATWIQSKGHYWFRCPLCGYQHMPWAFMRRPHQSSACQKSSQNCTNRARGDGSEYIRADYIKLIIT